MARAALTTEPSRVYVGMLVVTCMAMLVGITVLALESGEYGWEQNAPATPKIDLPKETAALPAGTGAAPVDAPKTETATAPKPEVPAVTVPNALPPILLPPVAVVEAPKPAVPEVKPEPKPQTTPTSKPDPKVPADPIPSPLFFPGR